MKLTMKKRTIIIVISIIVVLVATVTVYSIWNSEKNTEISYTTVKPGKGDIQIVVTATGTVNAVKTVLVGTQVSGVISKILVDYNDVVKARQVIALLDTRNLQVSLDEAKANLSKAQSQLDQIKADYERNQILYEKNLIDKSTFDIQTSTYKAAENTVQTAQGEVSRAVINLNFATITAPISGVIISRNVDVGQTVAASFSTPTLFTIANDLKKMQLQANVDEADIGLIKTGQNVYFTVDAYPDINFTGIVQQLRMQPITTNNVVSYAVMIDAPNDELKLLPGMNANISIVVQESKGVLKIPISALYFSPGQLQKGLDSVVIQKQRDSLVTLGQSMVFILYNGNLTPVTIQTGLSDGIKIEVISGALTPQSELVVGIKQNGVVVPQSKGLIQTPQRIPRR
jgi:HlyD family secretion protein